MTSACLCTDDKISYASLMFCSLWSEVDISETGQKQVYSYSKKIIKPLGKNLSRSLRTLSQKIFGWLSLTFPEVRPRHFRKWGDNAN